MKILLIGSGGREHSLCWKIAASPLCARLFCAPGNGGTAAVAENVSLDEKDHEAVVTFCRENTIELVVIGPEAPLVAGIVDRFEAAGLPCLGPRAAAAQPHAFPLAAAGAASTTMASVIGSAGSGEEQSIGADRSHVAWGAGESAIGESFWFIGDFPKWGRGPQGAITFP